MPSKTSEDEYCEHWTIEFRALVLLGVKQILKVMMEQQRKDALSENPKHLLEHGPSRIDPAYSFYLCSHIRGLSPDHFIREGFDSSSSRLLKDSLGITDREISELIGVTSRTIQRKLKAKEKFDMIASDRLYRLALVFAIATEVFENEEEARGWLREPQYDLGDRIPLEVIQTEAGAREVESLLRRIDKGVLA
jgi:putative toxin-antitoxin system antitoxin component (TIGR02293 family)